MMAEYSYDKFFVIPFNYAEEMPLTARGHLIAVMEQLAKLRTRDGVSTAPRYYVVSRDEPYGDEVLNTILLGEERKEKKR
jgi:hypothetical protein